MAESRPFRLDFFCDHFCRSPFGAELSEALDLFWVEDPFSLPGLLEPLTLSSTGTRALVGVEQVDAGSAILAGVGKALLDLLRAVPAVVAGHALQRDKQTPLSMQGSRAVLPQAGPGDLAPSVTWEREEGSLCPWTGTFPIWPWWQVAILPCSHGSPLARILPGREAYLAGIAAQVVRAGRPVLARVRGALVHLLFTVAARVPRLAMAEVGVAPVHAEPGVSAQAGNVQPWKSRRGRPLDTCGRPGRSR